MWSLFWIWFFYSFCTFVILWNRFESMIYATIQKSEKKQQQQQRGSTINCHKCSNWMLFFFRWCASYESSVTGLYNIDKCTGWAFFSYSLLIIPEPNQFKFNHCFLCPENSKPILNVFCYYFQIRRTFFKMFAICALVVYKSFLIIFGQFKIYKINISNLHKLFWLDLAI